MGEESSIPIGIARHISALKMKAECPAHLKQALSALWPDRDIWIESYDEEFNKLNGLNTFTVITEDEYQQLQKTKRYSPFQACAS